MDYLRLVRGDYRPEVEDMLGEEGALDKNNYKGRGGGNKSHPHYRPGTTHVIYGLESDLIMLGLDTHEPDFILLWEKMLMVMAGRG